jgi:hypothetical protein
VASRQGTTRKPRPNRVDRARNIRPQSHRIVVAGVQRDPRDRDVTAARQLRRHQHGIARAGTLIIVNSISSSWSSAPNRRARGITPARTCGRASFASISGSPADTTADLLATPVSIDPIAAGQSRAVARASALAVGHTTAPVIDNIERMIPSQSGAAVVAAHRQPERDGQHDA